MTSHPPASSGTGERPAWFETAITTRFEERTVEVSGAQVHYLRWGETGRPGLVLVHGGAAHAHWWSHIAPLLAQDYCVAAIDLTGHGDSDRRDTYPGETWAAEVMAVAADLASGRPIVVGHSMGGWVSIFTAARYSDDLAGIVILDSPVRRADPELESYTEGLAFGPPRRYETIDDALARFKTVPDQPSSLPYVIEVVARRSLVEVEGAWHWKFDPRIFDRPVPTGDLLRRVTCRVALFRSEFGLVTEDIGAYMYEQLGAVAPVIEVPQAWHHVMLDQPLALVTGLRTLLADWEHSSPLSRRDDER